MLFLQKTNFYQNRFIFFSNDLSCENFLDLRFLPEYIYNRNFFFENAALKQKVKIVHFSPLVDCLQYNHNNNFFQSNIIETIWKHSNNSHFKSNYEFKKLGHAAGGYIRTYTSYRKNYNSLTGFSCEIDPYHNEFDDLRLFIFKNIN